MSGAAGAAGGAAAAAAAIAATARRRRAAEEESMAGYRPEDLEGWEFKILRSGTAKAFGQPANLRAVLDEEARAGWELVEKFDDHRLRLKRRIEQRTLDTGLPFDAYRSWVGVSPNQLALRTLLATAAFLGAIAIIAALLN